MVINTNNREEVEREFVALILTQNKILKDTMILPKYFENKEIAKIYEYSLECFKNYGTVDITKIGEKHQDIDFILYTELIGETLIYSDWENHVSLYEESIINFYKQDIIKQLSDDLNNKKINMQTYIDKIKLLDSIKVATYKDQSSVLTLEDIDMTNEEQLEYVKSNTLELDNNTQGFALGQLSVWSGSNGGAKSTYLNQLAIESINQGYNVAIYSGELVAKRLIKWILMQCAGKRNMSYNSKDNYWFVNSFAKEKIIKWLNKKLYIYNNNNGNNVKNILSSLKECIKANNIKVIIIDNLMSMNLSSYGDNKYDVQSYQLKKN